MRMRWYLVQVDTDSSDELQLNPMQTGVYYCIFHARHPEDNKKSDEFSRWWPEWYDYKRNKATNEIIYGSRILIRPNVTPNPRKYIQWATPLCLGLNNNNHKIHGPFNFEPISATNRTHHKVTLQEWRKLFKFCDDTGVTPPTFGANHSIIPSRTKRTTTRQQGPGLIKRKASLHVAQSSKRKRRPTKF